MIDHVVFWVTDMARSKAFYDRVLQPLGIKRITGDDHAFAGYGVPLGVCMALNLVASVMILLRPRTSSLETLPSKLL